MSQGHDRHVLDILRGDVVTATDHGQAASGGNERERATGLGPDGDGLVLTCGRGQGHAVPAHRLLDLDVLHR